MWRPLRGFFRARFAARGSPKNDAKASFFRRAARRAGLTSLGSPPARFACRAAQDARWAEAAPKASAGSRCARSRAPLSERAESTRAQGLRVKQAQPAGANVSRTAWVTRRSSLPWYAEWGWRLGSVAWEARRRVVVGGHSWRLDRFAGVTEPPPWRSAFARNLQSVWRHWWRGPPRDGERTRGLGGAPAGVKQLRSGFVT